MIYEPGHAPHRHHFFILPGKGGPKPLRNRYVHLSERVCNGRIDKCVKERCRCVPCTAMVLRWIRDMDREQRPLREE